MYRIIILFKLQTTLLASFTSSIIPLKNGIFHGKVAAFSCTHSAASPLFSVTKQRLDWIDQRHSERQGKSSEYEF